MKNAFLKIGLGAALALTLAAAPAMAAEKHAKEHAANESAAKQHAHTGKNESNAEKDKCAEMMEHNKAPAGESADASKNGCGVAMGKKKGMNKH